TPGRLHRLDPGQPAGSVTTVASTLGDNPEGITFDGSRLWTADFGGSVSIVTPGAAIPWTVTTVTLGPFSNPIVALYDAATLWIPDYSQPFVSRLDGNGTVLQMVTAGGFPSRPTFDGTNLWVPVQSPDSMLVLRASTGAVLAQITGNGLTDPQEA